MNTCVECIERMRPEDPRVRSGKYRLCGCDYCDKPSYYRDIERVESPLKELKELGDKIAVLNDRFNNLGRPKTYRGQSKYS